MLRSVLESHSFHASASAGGAPYTSRCCSKALRVRVSESTSCAACSRVNASTADGSWEDAHLRANVRHTIAQFAGWRTVFDDDAACERRLATDPSLDFVSRERLLFWYRKRGRLDPSPWLWPLALWRRARWWVANPNSHLQTSCFGLDWIGMDWIGLDWIGLDWIGLD